MNPAAGEAPGSSQADLAVLGALTDREKAELLDALLADDATLVARAGREARSRLATVKIADVAIAVAEELLALDHEELSRQAGRTRCGYVEPTEAAWSLLEAALQPWLDDITRRAGLGFAGAARQIGLGVLEGLRHAGDGRGKTSDCCPGRRASRRSKQHGSATARRPRHRDRRSRRGRHVIAPNVPPEDTGRLG